MMDRRPIEYCYWVKEGQFLAGEYPMVKDDGGFEGQTSGAH